MKIFFINDHGTGFADHIEVRRGTTVEQLFKQKVPRGNPEDYLIRVGPIDRHMRGQPLAPESLAPAARDRR